MYIPHCMRLGAWLGPSIQHLTANCQIKVVGATFPGPTLSLVLLPADCQGRNPLHRRRGSSPGGFKIHARRPSGGGSGALEGAEQRSGVGALWRHSRRGGSGVDIFSTMGVCLALHKSQRLDEVFTRQVSGWDLVQALVK